MKIKSNSASVLIVRLLFIALTFLMAGESFAAAEKSRVTISGKDRSEKAEDDGETEVEDANSITETFFKTKTEIVTLNLKIKNGGKQPVKGQLEWYFISDHSSGKLIDYMPQEAEPAVFSPGKKEITLEAGSVVEETVVSAPFMYEEKTIDREWWNGDGGSTSRDYETGDVYEGYLVLITVNGEIIAKKSNTSKYQKDEWIEKCRNP